MADELIALFGKITTTDHEQLLDQFSKILGVQPNVSLFFLEASSWNVEVAVHNYLASIGNSKNPVFSAPPQAQFTGDLSQLQSQTLPANSKFSLQLTFRNIGIEPWPSDTRLAFVDGHIIGPEAIAIAAAPGEDTTVNFQLYTPAETGTYMGCWRLACSVGYFGDPLYLIIGVDKSLLFDKQDEGDYMDEGSFKMKDIHFGDQSDNEYGSAAYSSDAVFNGLSRSQLGYEQYRAMQSDQDPKQEDTDMVDL